MTIDASLLIGLPEAERATVRTLVHTPWYSMGVLGAYERLGEQSMRASAVIVRAQPTVCIQSLEIPLTSTQEAFRICIRLADSQDEARCDSLALTGRSGLLHGLQLLPFPGQVSLLWSRLEYPAGLRDSESKYVIVPDGIVFGGKGGRLLVSQDELPTWLRLHWDQSSVEQAVTRASRIESL